MTLKRDGRFALTDEEGKPKPKAKPAVPAAPYRQVENVKAGRVVLQNAAVEVKALAVSNGLLFVADDEGFQRFYPLAEVQRIEVTEWHVIRA